MKLFRKKKPFFAKCRPLDPEVVAAYGGEDGGRRSEAGNQRSDGSSQKPASSIPGTPDSEQQSTVLLQTSNSNPQTSRVAIFGDVHANLEALTAVLKDAKKRGVSRFACTGDLVGYGPNPSACLEMVKALNCPIVKGNHDEYSATDMSLNEFTLHAMNALIWTREQLSDEERSWLDALPMQMDLLTTEYTECTEEQKGDGRKDAQEAQRPDRDDGGLGKTLGSSLEDNGYIVPPENHQPSTSNLSTKMVHSTLLEPDKWRYVIKPEEAERVMPQQEQGLVFFGHTHVPSWYAFNPDSGEFKSEVPMTEGILELEVGWKYLCNPGSVGQPRDRDPRASYAIYDLVGRTIEWRRVSYNFKKTAKKIVAAELPDRNAQRLYKGR